MDEDSYYYMDGGWRVYTIERKHLHTNQFNNWRNIIKLTPMKISKHTIFGQFHVLPFIKITYDRTLNGEYELIIGWVSVGISFAFKPKQRRWVK